MNPSMIAVTQAMEEQQNARRKAQKHIERAMTELKAASRYGGIELILTEDQLRQIEEAKTRGDRITFNINFS